MTTLTVRHPDGFTATIVDGIVVDSTDIPPEVIARAEELAADRRVLHPGVEEPGYRLSFDEPAAAALTFAHAVISSPPTGLPVTHWAGYDADGVLVDQLPADAFVGGPQLDGQDIAMIVLVPTDPDMFVDSEGVSADALHVSLKYLGDAFLWDDEEREMIEGIVEAWVNRRDASYTGKVAGAGKLGDEEAAVLLLDLDDLQEQRAMLDAELEAEFGPEVEDAHPGYNPHLTTGYGTEPRYDLMGMPVAFDRVRVQWGTDVTEFELEDPYGVRQAPTQDGPEATEPADLSTMTEAQLRQHYAALKAQIDALRADCDMTMAKAVQINELRAEANEAVDAVKAIMALDVTVGEEDLPDGPVASDNPAVT